MSFYLCEYISTLCITGASVFVLSQAKISLFDNRFSFAHVLDGRFWQRIPNPTMSLLCHSFWNVDILRLMQTLNSNFFFKILENNMGNTHLSIYYSFIICFFYSPPFFFSLVKMGELSLVTAVRKWQQSFASMIVSSLGTLNPYNGICMIFQDYTETSKCFRYKDLQSKILQFLWVPFGCIFKGEK